MTTPSTSPASESHAESSAESKSRLPLILGVGVAVAAVLGGGAYAASKLMGGGPGAAQAMPASMVAYASLDLDPGAGQKIEAIKTIRKFPALRKQLDVKEDDDLRAKIFNEAVSGSKCEGKVDFADDVEPWLGDKAGAGAADLGEKEPTPVLALQVDDEDAATATMRKIADCADSSDLGGHVLADGYLLLSDTDAHAKKLAADAKKKSLADSQGYQEWHDKAGGDGIMSFYVSANAADLILSNLPAEVAGQLGDVESRIEKFKGAAGSLKFADGGLELSVVSDADKSTLGASMGDSLTQLPADTAVALGFGIPEDFAETFTQALSETAGGSSEQMLSQLETQSGLSLPEDLQTLLGRSMVLALGGDAPASLREVSGPADLPLGLKIDGDTDKIEAVIAKAEERAGQKLSDLRVVQDSDDDTVALATSPDTADSLLGKGKLGDSDRFSDVVPEGGDSAFALFVNFDSSWRDALADLGDNAMGGSSGDNSVAANLKPLGALGISAWRDGDDARGLVKLTTD